MLKVKILPRGSANRQEKAKFSICDANSHVTTLNVEYRLLRNSSTRFVDDPACLRLLVKAAECGRCSRPPAMRCRWPKRMLSYSYSKANRETEKLRNHVVLAG